MIEPFCVQPDAIYDDSVLNLIAGVSTAALQRARAEGTLRFTKQGHRILYRGRWILDWLEKAASKSHEVRQ